MKRVFIGLPLTDKAAHPLLKAQNHDISGARWQMRDNLHITLNFLGEVEDKDLEALQENLRKIHQNDFTIHMNGVGTFTRGKTEIPKILWAGVEKTAALVNLKEAVDKACRTAGIHIDDRPYCPHVTIARLTDASREDVENFLKEHKNLSAPAYRAKEFILYQSHLHDTGSIYRPLRHFPLQNRQH